jgi:hypothetical protein
MALCVNIELELWLDSKLELNFLNVINHGKTDGLAMGTPTSAVLDETCIQHVEHKQIYPVLIKQRINEYYRYVDDIFVIYDQNETSMKHTHKVNSTNYSLL